MGDTLLVQPHKPKGRQLKLCVPWNKAWGQMASLKRPRAESDEDEVIVLDSDDDDGTMPIIVEDTKDLKLQANYRQLMLFVETVKEIMNGDDISTKCEQLALLEQSMHKDFGGFSNYFHTKVSCCRCGHCLSNSWTLTRTRQEL